METKRHRKATLKKRMEEQEYYRSSKAKALGDAIMSAHKTPILTKLSKSPRAATTRECRSKLADIALAREYGIEVSDML